MKTAKDEKSKLYGFVSEYDKRPLFDKDDKSVSFSSEVFDRREKEVLDCAKRAGFKRVSLTPPKVVTFERVQNV